MFSWRNMEEIKLMDTVNKDFSLINFIEENKGCFGSSTLRSIRDFVSNIDSNMVCDFRAWEAIYNISSVRLLVLLKENGSYYSSAGWYTAEANIMYSLHEYARKIAGSDRLSLAAIERRRDEIDNLFLDLTEDECMQGFTIPFEIYAPLMLGRQSREFIGRPIRDALSLIGFKFC